MLIPKIGSFFTQGFFRWLLIDPFCRIVIFFWIPWDSDYSAFFTENFSRRWRRGAVGFSGIQNSQLQPGAMCVGCTQRLTLCKCLIANCELQYAVAKTLLDGSISVPKSAGDIPQTFSSKNFLFLVSRFQLRSPHSCAAQAYPFLH